MFLPGNWWLSWRIKGSSCNCGNRWLSICPLFSQFTLPSVLCFQRVGFSNIWAHLTFRTNSFCSKTFLYCGCAPYKMQSGFDSWYYLMAYEKYLPVHICWMHLSFSSSVLNQEFEDSGDPEKHLQDLLTLAKEGIEKGKVRSISLSLRLWIHSIYTFLVNALSI